MDVGTNKPNIKIEENNPHGLGDPNDRTLRKIELNVLIKKKVREAALEKCADYMNEFRKCAKENGMSLVILCRPERNALMKCMKWWFDDEELNKKMKEEYLEERRYYRETGVPKKKVEKRIGS